MYYIKQIDYDRSLRLVSCKDPAPVIFLRRIPCNTHLLSNLRIPNQLRQCCDLAKAQRTYHHQCMMLISLWQLHVL